MKNIYTKSIHQSFCAIYYYYEYNNKMPPSLSLIGYIPFCISPNMINVLSYNYRIFNYYFNVKKSFFIKNKWNY